MSGRPANSSAPGALARSPLLALALPPVGGVLVWLAERVWPGTAASPYLAAVGAACLTVALALALPHFLERRGQPGLRGAAGWLIAPHALFVLALVLYFAARTLAGDPAGGGGTPDWVALARGGWRLSAVAGAVLYVFVALALLAQRRLPHADARRIGAAGAAGLSLALLALLVVLVNVALAHLPWQWNVAYFRTTRPGPATQEVVQGLAEPVQVGLFFAADSAVRPLVESYFEALQAAADAGGERLQVETADADLRPDLAEAYKARGNGWVVVRKGDLTRPVHVGETIERARSELAKLDATMFSRLLEVSRPRRTVYLTVGHGERNERGGRRAAETSFGRFRTVLRDRNYAMKDLGVGEGLSEGVPEDAALVIVAAPEEPFLPAEADSLRRYLGQGGRLLVFLEPHRRPRETGGLPGTPVEELLAEYGVTYEPVQQANDRIYGRRTYTRADHALLVTVRYERHPAVATLRRAAGQYPLLLLGAGALREGKAPKDLSLAPTVRAMPGTWGDVDGDFQFDPRRERRGEPVLALAVSAGEPVTRRRKARQPDAEQPGMRLLVFADADLAADLLIQNRANRQLLEDALGWLVQEDAPVGLPESEEDVRIQHAKADDWLWFYLPVLGVPALVLGLGLYRVGRQRRGARDPAQGG